MFYISEEVKRNTIKCKNNFSCLSGRGENLCKVISSINDGKLFVFCVNSITCVYQRELNGRIICTCPTRSRIYLQYKV